MTLLHYLPLAYRTSRSLCPLTISVPRLGPRLFSARSFRGEEGITPDEEQASVVRAVKSGFNVVVPSVAGSGKTTTVRFIADALPSKRILVLTYNRHLCNDTATRLEQYTNAQVRTLHSYVSHRKAYNFPCLDDVSLSAFTRERPALVDKGWADIVVVDEAQDLNPLLYKAVSKILSDLGSVQLVVLGDSNQAIYQFLGADPRYLTLAKWLFSHVNSLEWRERELRASYRITAQTALFINKAVVQFYRLQGKERGERPQYLQYQVKHMCEEDDISDYLLKLIKMYGPQNTMVLAPFLRRNISTMRFENFLVNKGIPVYVPPNENDGEPCPDVAAGKVKFSTFHRSKGRQDDLVILFGFEWAPYHHYSREKCPNKLYVGLTRAKKQLVVLQDSTKSPLPFLDVAALRETVSMSANCCIPTPCEGNEMASDNIASTRVEVTDLLRWLPFTEIENAAHRLTVECITPPLPDHENKIMQRLPARHRNKEVSDLTGVAMGKYIQKIHNGETVAASRLLRDVTKASARGYIGRLRQLQVRKGFNWVPQTAFDLCQERFCAIIGKDNSRLTFEHRIDSTVDISDLTGVSESRPHVLNGEMDVLQEPEGSHGAVTIIELKFTDRLQPTHQLQLAIYGWMYEKGNGSIPKLLLFSPKTNELQRIEVPRGKVMDDLVKRLLHFRHNRGENHPEFTDEEFLVRNLKIKNEMLK